MPLNLQITNECDLKVRSYKDFSSHLVLKALSIYIARYPGRDCRDPDAKDGNYKAGYKFAP